MPPVMLGTHLFVLLVLLGSLSTSIVESVNLLYALMANAKCVQLELSTEVQNVLNALLKTVQDVLL